MTIWLSESAKQELKSFSNDNKNNVAEAVALLSDDSYREKNQIDLCLIENGCKMWALVAGRVWLAFHEDTNGDICVDWVSLRSRFRP